MTVTYIGATMEDSGLEDTDPTSSIPRLGILDYTRSGPERMTALGESKTSGSSRLSASTPEHTHGAVAPHGRIAFSSAGTLLAYGVKRPQPY
jgi:hypothetical protein